MARYEITAPDGSRYEITAPEGASEQNIMAYARQNLPSRREAAATERDAMARGLGLGTRAVAEGLAAIPGLVANPLISAANLIPGVNLPKYEEATKRNLSRLGLPEPQSAEERVTARVIQEMAGVIPTMGLGAAMKGAQGTAGLVGRALAEKPIVQAAGAAGSGLAAGTARESGAGPILETLAGLGGSLTGMGLAEGGAMAGRAARAMGEPFTQPGRERIAGDVLLRSSADPEGLAQRLQAGMDDPMRRLPGSPVTTAQAARDPGLMVLEQGLRSDAGRVAGQGGMSGAVALRDTEAMRNAARTGFIEGMADDLTPDVRGSQVRDLLDQSKRDFSQRVSGAYKAAEQKGIQLPIDDLKQAAAEAAAKFYGPGSGGAPAQLKGILEEIGQAEGPQNFEWTQNVRARLGEVQGMAARSGENRLAAAAGEIRASLDNLSDSALSDAASLRREMGRAFGRDETGVNAAERILSRDRFGAPMTQAQNIGAQALASRPAVDQVLKAAGSRAEEVKGLLRGQFIENMMNATRTTGVVTDAAGNVSDALSPAQFKRFFDKNSDVAKAIFDKPGQFMALQRLANDFAETSLSASMGRARGSDTAQNLSVGNLIARASHGLIDPTSPGAQTLVSLGPVGRFIYAAPEAATRELLVEAARDPKFAAMLLKKAGPDAVKNASAYLNSTAGDRFRQALDAASTRLQAQSLVSQQMGDSYGPE